MVTFTFEYLIGANIKIYTYGTKTVVFCVKSRHSLKTSHKVPGIVSIVQSLRDFRRKIEEYVYELPKY